MARLGLREQWVWVSHTASLHLSKKSVKVKLVIIELRAALANLALQRKLMRWGERMKKLSRLAGYSKSSSGAGQPACFLCLQSLH